MQPTKIDWTDEVWNPLIGCENNCDYCYARVWANRLAGHKEYSNSVRSAYKKFQPAFFKNRLNEPLNKITSKMIFSVDMGDMFSDTAVKEGYTKEILKVMHRANNHIFQILTKNPKNMTKFNYPDNVWLGVTIDLLEDNDRMIRIPPEIALQNLVRTNAGVKFVSFEPLLGPKPKHLSLNGLDWIIIGARTGSKKVQPNPRWVKEILQYILANKELADSLRLIEDRGGYTITQPLEKFNIEAQRLIDTLGSQQWITNYLHKS